MKQILAAIDFSDITGVVLEKAAELARAFSARLTLLHVAAPDPDFVGYEPGPQSVRNSRADELRTERRDLEKHATSLLDSGVETDWKLIMGPTVKTVLDVADDVGADLIVAGSHGHGALYNALVGSVTEGVMRRAKCPVLVVPAST